MSTRTALLQALVLPGYGAELIERVLRATSGMVRIPMGSLYPTLDVLEREGLVRATVVRPRRGRGRPRVYYELTPPGVAARAADQRAIQRLFQFEQGRLPRESADTIARRLRRSSQLSASLLRLRRQVMAASR